MRGDLNPIDEFERELRQAFERRPAPPGLKRKIMAAARRLQRTAAHARALAAAGGVDRAGCCAWAAALRVRKREERRKGEAPREQVLTALRIAEPRAEPNECSSLRRTAGSAE